MRRRINVRAPLPDVAVLMGEEPIAKRPFTRPVAEQDPALFIGKTRVMGYSRLERVREIDPLAAAKKIQQFTEIHQAMLPNRHSRVAYADAVVDAINGRTDVALVAQSMGAFTAPLVWQRVPTRLVVFVNAIIPQPGETPGEWWDNVGSEQARTAATAHDGYSAEFDRSTYFMHDIPEALAEEMLQQAKPRKSGAGKSDTSPDRWTARSSPSPAGWPIPQTPVRRDHEYIERTPTNRRTRHMSTTATQTKTQTTLIAKIRNWLRQLRGGQDAMFRYDREFQA
jgi:hypothetical protein